MKTIDEIIKEPTLYPEIERKPEDVRRRELENWKDKYGEINEAYNLYGMDRRDSAPVDEWLDWGGVL